MEYIQNVSTCHENLPGVNILVLLEGGSKDGIAHTLSNAVEQDLECVTTKIGLPSMAEDTR